MRPNRPRRNRKRSPSRSSQPPIPISSQHLFTPDGKLRSFVNVYLNDEDVRYLEDKAGHRRQKTPTSSPSSPPSPEELGD